MNDISAKIGPANKLAKWITHGKYSKLNKLNTNPPTDDQMNRMSISQMAAAVSVLTRCAQNCASICKTVKYSSMYPVGIETSGKQKRIGMTLTFQRDV